MHYARNISLKNNFLKQINLQHRIIPHNNWCLMLYENVIWSLN